MDIKNIQTKLKKYISKLYNLHITQNYDINKYNTYLSKTKYYYDIIGGKGGKARKLRKRRKSKKSKKQNSGGEEDEQEEGEGEGEGEEEGEQEEGESEEGEEQEGEGEGEEGEQQEGDGEEEEQEGEESKEGEEDNDDDEEERNPKLIKQNIAKFEKEIYEIYEKFLKLTYEKKVLWLIKIIKFLVKNKKETSLIIRRLGKFNKKKDNRNNKKKHQAKRRFVEENLSIIKILFFSYKRKENIFDSVVELYFLKFSTLFLIQNNIIFFEKFMNRHKKKEEKEEKEVMSTNNIVHLKILNKVLSEVKSNLDKLKREQLEGFTKNQVIEKIDNITKPFESQYIPFIDKLNIIFTRINDLANIFAENDNYITDDNEENMTEMPNIVGKLIGTEFANYLNLSKIQKRVIQEITILFRKKYLLRRYDENLMLIIIIRKIIDELNIEISELTAVDKELSYDRKILKVLIKYISNVDKFEDYVVKILKLFEELQK